MEKILFIVPMHITMDSFVNPSDNTRRYRKDNGKYYNSLRTDLPLGPLSMSGYLKKFANVDVKLIDFNVELSHAKEFPYQCFFDYCHDYLCRWCHVTPFSLIYSLIDPLNLNYHLNCSLYFHHDDEYPSCHLS